MVCTIPFPCLNLTPLFVHVVDAPQRVDVVQFGGDVLFPELKGWMLRQIDMITNTNAGYFVENSLLIGSETFL